MIIRMLAREPQDRWSAMGEIVTELRGVEAERRALAKESYVKWIDTDTRFFEDFYRAFFATRVAKQAHSAQKFENREQQHEKLRKGMAAVLNFRPGNEPTSLRYVIGAHQHKGVTHEELTQFEETFMKVLTQRLDKRLKGTGALARREADIVAAWREQFGLVMRYFQENGLKPPGRAG